MIFDHHLLSLKVDADESICPTDISMNLGLITTELVIDAIKHAFPDNRSGTITVSYRAKNGNWTLSVDDNGMGLPQAEENSKAGLGTHHCSSIGR